MDPESRLDPRNYTLSKIQLSYLDGGDIGTRREANLEEEVNDVVSNLDSRLQYLVEDLALIYGKGHLNTESWPDAWDDLTDIQRSDELFNSPSAYRGSPRDFEYIRLAIHLGHVLRILYRNTAPEFDESKIAMGVILGLNGGFLKETWDETSSDEAFLEYLSDEDEYFQEFRMPSNETLQSLNDVIDEIQNGLKSHPATESTNQDLRDQLESSELTVTEPIMKAATQKLEEHEGPPIPSVVGNVVEVLESDSKIRDIEQLADQIEGDIAILNSTVYQKANAIDVFYAFYKSGEYFDEGVSAIASAADTKGHQVRKLRNDFLGGEKPWSDRPLIFEDQVGISPTDYGILVGQILTSEEGQNEGPESLAYHVPSRRDIVSICHANLFGENGPNNQELIERILTDGFIEGNSSG